MPEKNVQMEGHLLLANDLNKVNKQTLCINDEDQSHLHDDGFLW